jgi:hypothetical protein
MQEEFDALQANKT